MNNYKDYGYTDAYMPHAFAYVLNPLLKLLSNKKNHTILDLGCGNGALVKHLLNMGYNAYGIDASESGIKMASKTNPGRFALNDITNGITPDEFADLKFDTIIATEVIEHLYQPKEFVAYCKQVLLKNGSGEIIISTPYHGYFKNLTLAITGKWDQHANPLWDGGHIKFWSKQTLSQLLTEQGFELTDFVGCGRVPFLWKSMLIKARI